MSALEGKTAIVTGAGQGVGEGVAIALADEGAAVVCAGRTLAKVERTATTIGAHGNKAFPFQCDVTSPREMAQCVTFAASISGTIDILVNNAVVPPLGRLLELDEESFETGWRSGPLATFRLMRLCYPYLADGGGVIINMGTGSALMPNLAGFGAYAATKEGIRMLTRAAACEWGRDGIRVNVVLPLAGSPALASYLDDIPEGRVSPTHTIPLGRIGHCAEDIGKAVAMLCRPEMHYITGTTIAIDGGQTPMR